MLSAQIYTKRSLPAENKAMIQDFIADRLQQILNGPNLRHDVLEAVMANKANAFTLAQKQLIFWQNIWQTKISKQISKP